MYEDVLIYDLETKTTGTPNAENDILKFFGCYSYKSQRFYLLKTKADIQKIISAHKFLVGFNNYEYDNVILKREGFDLKYKICIDLMKLFKTRAVSMKIKQGMLSDLLIHYSLDYITRTLGLVDDTTAKIEFDYSILNKSTYTESDMKLIYDYTKRDIDITKKLYEWVEDYFKSFRLFLNQDDVDKKVYLTSSVAKFCYKAICKELRWKEEYDENAVDDIDEDKISGGYVSYPFGEKFEGNIFALDVNSMYPHCMMQMNLYGRKREDNLRPVAQDVWGLEGKYYSDEMSEVGKLIKRWYAERVEYKKKGDPREYALKIMLNTLYGILDKPYYSLVYDKVAASDCTKLGREWIIYLKRQFQKNGYTVLAIDTDSNYILDPFNDKDRLLKVKDDSIRYIKSTVPFPQETFDMKIESEIKYMYFFKGKVNAKENELLVDEDAFNKTLGFLKKNYIYVDVNDKITIKNLGIRKKSNSELSKKIFWEYIVEHLKKGQAKFSKTEIRNLINNYLQKDISLACLRKDVGDISEYSKSPNGLHAQIASKYGKGIHMLIPNNAGVGVGKDKSYCTLDEFNKHKLRFEHIDLDFIWSELNYFLKVTETKNIFDYFGKT